MSPALAKTSTADIIAAARDLVAADGAESVTLQSVASAVGVKTPSLYKRIPDRPALLCAVRDLAFAELAERLSAVRATDPRRALEGLGETYLAFATERRHLYALLFDGSLGPATEAERAAATPVLAIFLDDPDSPASRRRALAAARVLTAYLHGFASMLNGGNFRLGPDADAAFKLGFSLLIDGLLKPAGRARKVPAGL